MRIAVTKKTFLFPWLLFLLFFSSAAFGAEKTVVVDHETATIAGPLQLVRQTWPTPGSRYWEVTHQLVFKGKTIIGPSSSGIEIEAAYPSQFDARLVLVFESSGGNSCEGQYRIIELDTSGIRNITAPFGDCSLGASTFSNDTLSVTIGGKTWRYAQGALREPEAPVRPTAESSIQEEVEALVKRWLQLGQDNDKLTETMALYDDRVEFYKFGGVARERVALDKRNYFERWPFRTHRLLSCEFLPHPTDDEQQVKVVFQYRIENRKHKVLQGDSHTLLTLRRIGGRLLIVRENEAPKDEAVTEEAAGRRYLVWDGNGGTVEIDGKGKETARSRQLLAVRGEAAYRFDITPRTVKIADCSTVDWRDADSNPKPVEAELPELSVVRIGPAGRESRRIILPAEGDESGEVSSTIELLGLAGPWLFVVRSTYYYGCGAAHGGVGNVMRIYNVESGEQLEIAPPRPKGPAPGKQPAAASLFSTGEQEMLVEMLGPQAVNQLDDEMITAPGELRLTKVRPIMNNDALGLELLLTGDTCYACSDGLWNSYTRSAPFLSPLLPQILVPYRKVPAPVLA